MDGLEITKNTASGRYEARVAGEIVSIANFTDQGDRRLFPHTSTFAGNTGKGYATALVEQALRETIDEGKTIVPACSFVKRVASTPEFAAHLSS